MKTLVTAAATISLLLAPLAEASPKNGRGNGNGNGNGNGAWASGVHCPPGLADRNPACVPPGQAGRGEGEARRADRDEQGETENRSEELIELAEDDRDGQEALAIVGALTALALIERARRNAEPEAAVAPAPIAPFPSLLSFSEVPSRPSFIEALAAAPSTGDATDLEAFTSTAGPESPTQPVAAAETAEPVAPPADRLVPLGTLATPVPTPQEETLLTDVFRRAAQDGGTGF